MNTFDKIELLELVAELAEESLTVVDDGGYAVSVIDAKKFLDNINKRLSQYETEIEAYVMQQVKEV